MMHTCVRVHGEVQPSSWPFAAVGPLDAHRAERQEWMDTAVEVLAFRLTHGITHSVVAPRASVFCGAATASA